MTKGSNPSRDEHKELHRSCMQFRTALNQYKDASESERQRLGAVMGDHVKMITSTLNELSRKGAYKHQVRLDHDYKAYMKEGSAEHFAALEQDIRTLMEFNQI